LWVELVAAFLNPAQQVIELRAVLVRVTGPEPPADEPDLDAIPLHLAR
jgi:hypothetical protein